MLKLPKYETVVVDNLEDLKSDILSSNNEFVACDTETNGLRWMAGDRAFGVSLAWDNKATFIRNENFGSDKIGLLLKDLYNSNKTISFHNAEFDLHMIDESYGVDILPNKIMDSLRVGHLLDSAADHSLKGWGSNVFGPSVTYHEDLLKDYRSKYKIKDYSMIPSMVLDPYASGDAILTKALLDSHIDQVRREFDRMLSVELALIPIIFEMEKNGLLIDLEYINNRRKELKKKLVNIERQIFKLAGNKYINPGSSKQVAEFFYNRMKIRLMDDEGMDSGITNADVDALNQIKLQEGGDSLAGKMAGLIIDWRGIEKEDTTYLEPYQNLHVNGRIHPHWNACGPITGRFSGSNPNVQNIPRDKAVRRCFIPDRWFVDMDYDQIEYKLFAFAAKESSIFQAYADGLDFHALTGSIIFNKSIFEVTKDERNVGKTMNFLTLYGGGKEKFASGAKISIERAEEIIRDFWSSYPNLNKYVWRLKNQARREGCVYTLLGRKVPIRGGDYTAPNYAIQGSAGDVIKIALIKVHKVIKELGVQIRNTVHDQIVFDGLEFKDVPKVVEAMEDFNFSYPDDGLVMPITTGVKHSFTSWGDMSEEWSKEEKYNGKLMPIEV